MTPFSYFEFKFDERKTTQAAGQFLQLRGGKMSHLKLIKLLYLMDREALKRWNSPVTGDSYVSMPHGPVLSSTYNLMAVSGATRGYWEEHISEIGNHEVQLRTLPEPGDLSEAEIGLIEEIFERFGNMTRWQVRDYTHTLPEWEDPGQSSIPIQAEDLLKQLGKTDEQIAQIRSHELSVRQIETILDRV